jgi:hypothetical protein
MRSYSVSVVEEGNQKKSKKRKGPDRCPGL